MRLIDADALEEALNISNDYHANNSREKSLLDRVVRIVQEQPTVDVEIPVAIYENGQFIKLRKFDTEGGEANETN
jgi:hypothetical protein